MAGTRPARPLPYDFAVHGQVTPERRFRLAMANSGTAGIVLTVHDATDRLGPWHYTIGAGHDHASEQWHEDGLADGYDLIVRGPNGFLQHHGGRWDGAADAAFARDGAAGATLLLSNRGPDVRHFTVAMGADYAAGQREQHHLVPPGRSVPSRWSFASSDGWHDLRISVREEPAFLRRYAGSLGNRRTDPAIGAMRMRS